MRAWVIILWVLAAMTAIAATVLFYIFIQPEKKAAKMPKFIRIIRDILDMKDLYLEYALKALYVCGTIFCVVGGIYMFLGFGPNYYGGIRWYGGYGLLLMLLGPVVLRLVYELILMFVLLVKNTMQINKKMKAPEGMEEEKKEEPAPAPEKPGVVIVQTHE